MMNSVLQSAAAMRPTRTSTANSEGTGQKRREGCHGVLCEAKGCPFFFSSRRRHTRCGRDCSSDVCSSDLANLYLASMVLKNWYETQPVDGEKELMQYSMTLLLHRTEKALDEFLKNLPNRPVAMALRAVTLPLGRRWAEPGDELTGKLAQSISTDTPVRNKLLEGAWTTAGDGDVVNPVAQYNSLLKDYRKAEQLYRKASKAYAKGELPMTALHPEERFEAALEAGIFSQEEADFMREYEALVLEMLTVDDFPFDEFARNKDTLIDHNPA